MIVEVAVAKAVARGWLEEGLAIARLGIVSCVPCDDLERKLKLKLQL